MQRKRSFPRKEMFKPRKQTISQQSTPREVIWGGIGRLLDALKKSAQFRPGICFKGHLEKVIVQEKGGVPHVSFAVSHIPVQQVLSVGARRGNQPRKVEFPEMEIPRPGSYKVKNLSFEHDAKSGIVRISTIPETSWHNARA